MLLSELHDTDEFYKGQTVVMNPMSTKDFNGDVGVILSIDENSVTVKSYINKTIVVYDKHDIMDIDYALEDWITSRVNKALRGER